MLNATGSNTGGWNTKNRGSNLQSQNVGDHHRNSEVDITDHKINDTMEKRQLVDLNMAAMAKGGNITGVGNGNVIELFLAGKEQERVVNITVAFLSEGSNAEDSGNGNVIRIYVGDSTMEEMKHARLIPVVNNGTTVVTS